MAECDFLVLTVQPEDESVRIDKYLSAQMETLSRSYLQKLLKEGQVFVNGAAVKPNYKVARKDEIRVSLPKEQEPEIEAENIPLDILYEDTDLLVVNKPKNMVVHPAAGHYEHTLVNCS